MSAICVVLYNIIIKQGVIFYEFVLCVSILVMVVQIIELDV